jgi:2-(1,2-epoxy-1,2-dihydrophenyl)acetyl-CoA isomerase
MSDPVSDPLVLLHQSDGVAEIRFNRPGNFNALSIEMADAFAEAVDAAIAAPETRAIVLAANGRGFVAGGDLASMGADPAHAGDVVDRLLGALNPAILALAQQDAPVIVAVRGVAAGAGLALMLGADLVVADQDARFMLAYDQIGGVPDCGATWFLARKLSRGAARKLVLLGAPMTAPEALALGLVTEVCPEPEVESRAMSLARKLAQGPTRALGAVRHLLDQADHTPLAAQLDAERAAFVAAAGTEDFKTGVAAFLSKTKPQFQGR